MAELVHTFAQPVEDPEGRRYAASVRARERDDGIWEAWLEFAAIGRSVVLRTERETEQSNRRGVRYWAAGLQQTYLDGALRRAVRVRMTALRERGAR